MVIAGSTEELLWNVSYQALLETMLTRQYVVERHSNLLVTPATEHEETTTSNLLRHLGYYGQGLGVMAVQHTRTLEGGLSKGGKQVIVPSGADLELALEVGPGRWLDLLLQAKALKATGNYTSWSPGQNKKLITWALSHGRVPGMLLYNDLVPPFVTTTPPTASADFVCSAFGACSPVGRAQLGTWASNSWCVGPGRTPAGISLCLDQALMLSKPASPAAIYSFHFQLEHLLHRAEFSSAVDAFGTTLDDLAQPMRPAWATQLLEARVADEESVLEIERSDGDDGQTVVAARASAVIPFVGGDG